MYTILTHSLYCRNAVCTGTYIKFFISTPGAAFVIYLSLIVILLSNYQPNLTSGLAVAAEWIFFWWSSGSLCYVQVGEKEVNHCLREGCRYT